MQKGQYSYDLSAKSDVSDELINVYVMRPTAGVVVRVLYHTSVTPNQITIAAMLCGFVAAVFYSSGTPRATILAGVFVTLKDLLDSADGQLARVRGLYSRRGRFLDSIGDFLVNLLIFTAIGSVLSLSSGNIAYAVLSFLGFAGMTLRVSYHVYYQSSFLHLHHKYTSNRITEEIREEDLHEDGTTLVLQRIFQALYGWQDRMMARLDEWCRRGSTIDEKEWFADRLGLRIAGFLGLGTELFLLAVCSILNQLTLYLYCNVILMNCLLFAGIWYRRRVLRERLSGRTPSGASFPV